MRTPLYTVELLYSNPLKEGTSILGTLKYNSWGHLNTTAFVSSFMEPVVYITEELARRPQRSWQDRIPDTHLDNGSNEERETIREHEGHAPSPSANPKERKGEI